MFFICMDLGEKKMKLKSKLVISFCIIMFVPILLAFLVIAAFFKVQWQMIAQNIELMPDVRGLFIEIVCSVILVLFLTAAMLMVWIYQSMVTPIRKLQAAAENIKTPLQIRHILKTRKIPKKPVFLKMNNPQQRKFQKMMADF